MKEANGHLYVCGTRAVVKISEELFYIVCATCGNKKHSTTVKVTAIAYCTSTSDRVCSKCGNLDGTKLQ